MRHIAAGSIGFLSVVLVTIVAEYCFHGNGNLSKDMTDGTAFIFALMALTGFVSMSILSTGGKK